LENEKTLALLQLAEIEKVKQFYAVNKGLKLILEDFVELMKSQLKNRVIVVLFGSYAKGTATKESDIDILLISKGKIDVEKITREIYAKYGKEITPIVMTPNDFKKQMEKALIKEIIKDHYILYGVENFINLVFRR
jgi:predicted nucleotidyltransferase